MERHSWTAISTMSWQRSRRRIPATEFHQAVREVLQSLGPAVDRRPEYRPAKILERLVEPERVIMFRVSWVDDRARSTSTAATGSR